MLLAVAGRRPGNRPDVTLINLHVRAPQLQNCANVNTSRNQTAVILNLEQSRTKSLSPKICTWWPWRIQMLRIQSRANPPKRGTRNLQIRLRNA